MTIRKMSGKLACDNTDGNDAVSAVVGVMLMLVVTLIIAAVISAYAGGMVSIHKKPEQVTISARTADEKNALLFDHMGGDSISLADTVIILDQGNRNVRISSRNNISDTLLFNKAGTSFVRSGDSVKLVGGTDDYSHTWFNTSDSGNISIEWRKEFTWILLSRTSNSILARGTLVF